MQCLRARFGGNCGKERSCSNDFDLVPPEGIETCVEHC